MNKDEELRELSDRLVDEMREPVLMFDKQGTILFANRAAGNILKYQKDELLQCGMVRIFRREFQTDSGEPLAFAAERIRDGQETVMYLKTNACIPVMVRVFPMEDDGIYCLLAEDLSEQKELTARIRSLQEKEQNNRRERNEFTANVTHELRTPVNGIRGHAEVLMGMTQDPEQRRILDIILYCCSNMSSMINNILDFSKLEAGKFSIEEQEFDFYEMMDKVIATHISEINKKELKFGLEVDEQIPRLLVGDGMRIAQILNNLLSNAVKFTAIGYVSVVASMTRRICDKVELFFMVKDSGIGISREESGRLFQSFTQADASITRCYGGTGLGLAITKQLVELMNGNIFVESEPGQGSTFSFSIQVKAGRNADGSGKLEELLSDWNQFGTAGDPGGDPAHFVDNREELNKRMDKLALSIEMNVWDKAELFCSTIKMLAGHEDREVNKRLLRLEMAVRKENYEKSVEEYEKLKEALKEA